MMKSKSGKVNIEINGFMIFLMGIFVVLPPVLAALIVGVICEKDKIVNQGVETTQPKQIVFGRQTGKSSLMEVSGNSAVIGANTKVKIPLLKM